MRAEFFESIETRGFGTFEPRPVSVHAERILRIQGYSDPQRVRPAIRKAAQAMAILAEETSQPRVAYRRLPVRACTDGALELEGGTTFRCDAFPRFLGGVTETVVFVLTAGRRLDERVIEFTESGEGLLEAVLLETAGWLCIEDVTRQFRGFLRQEAESRNYGLTPRMGPGYSYKFRHGECEWSLHEHDKLFALFDGAQLPVKLLPSCAMFPKMSRSGLFGIRPEPARHQVLWQ